MKFYKSLCMLLNPSSFYTAMLVTLLREPQKAIAHFEKVDMEHLWMCFVLRLLSKCGISIFLISEHNLACICTTVKKLNFSELIQNMRTFSV